MELLLEHEPAGAVLETPQPRQERQPEQIVAERLVRHHQRGDIADDEVADLDFIEPDRRGAHDAVGSLDLGDEFALRRVDTKAPRIACGERDHRRAGINHEAELAALDAAVNLEMTAGVARHDYRPCSCRRGSHRRRRTPSQRGSRWPSADLRGVPRHDDAGGQGEDGEDND